MTEDLIEWGCDKKGYLLLNSFWDPTRTPRTLNCIRKEGESEMTKYKCGHETELLVIDSNPLSLSAYLEWVETVGRDGDKWACWCKERNSFEFALKIEGQKELKE